VRNYRFLIPIIPSALQHEPFKTTSPYLTEWDNIISWIIICQLWLAVLSMLPSYT